MWVWVLRSLQSIWRLCRWFSRASFLRVQLPRLMFITPLLSLRVLSHYKLNILNRIGIQGNEFSTGDRDKTKLRKRQKTHKR